MSPQQLPLLELAKKAATNSHFTEAISLRDQSRVVAQQDLENRLQAAGEDVEINSTQRRGEIVQLAQRLEAELRTRTMLA